MPVRQARPYPRRGSTMTRAPCAAAISRVASVEPASTTSTSVTRDAGISSRTRAIELASSYVGMTTLTRIPMELSSEAPTWIAAREQRVHAPRASGPRPRETECDHHGHRQLPDPGRAELRHPQGEEERSGGGGHDARRDARHQEHAESELGHGLQRRDDARVGCHDGHDPLPDGGCVSVLQVIVDDSFVPRRRVRAFAQVLEKNPDEHRAERHTQHRQRALLAGRPDHLRCVVFQRIPPLPLVRTAASLYPTAATFGLIPRSTKTM